MTKRINLQAFKDFTKSSYFGSLILFIAVVLSLVIANTFLSNSFHAILNTQFGFENKLIQLRFSTESWINDGLMTVFFLLVGLEIKRELVEGELSSFKQASLPIMAAFGGAIVPAIIFFGLNYGKDTIHGWGIPMATDIAFALAAISLLGKSVPSSLKIFLAALAIVDDLIAILVIALFYTNELHLIYLFYAGIIICVLILFNRLGIKNYLFYVIPGLFVWYFVHHSGIHATIAGVAVAFTLPTNTTADESPLEKLEHAIQNPVNYFIIPLFALVNTNITYIDGMFSGLFTPLGLGILLGLLLGKTIGISLTCFVATKFKIASLPENSTWFHIIGIGFLAGIGFTMSIFVSLLSFDDVSYINEAKFSILITSTLAGIIGYQFLKRVDRSNKLKKEKIN
jgi:NhaA family Na+:H+ antiporter